MEINSAGPVGGSTPAGPVGRSGQAGGPAGTTPIATNDEVEISDAGRLMGELDASQDVHAGRLDQIRRQIAADAYESPEILDAAVDRLLDEINGGN